MVSDKASRKTSSVQVVAIVAVSIFILTILVYTPALKNDFVWDDGIYVCENTKNLSFNVQSLYWMFTSFHAGNWHPLTWLSHAIDYTFWGLEPLGHHLTSIMFHGLNALLVFILVLRLVSGIKPVNEVPSASKIPSSIPRRSLVMACITALLFGLHPLQVESVAWVSQRKNLLCNFFVLLSILSYLSYASSVVKRHRRIWFTACLFLFIFALMSKPMAVTLPAILLLLDIYPLKRMSLYPAETGKKLSVFLEKIPFFALSIASGIITILAQHSGEAIKSLEQISTSARLLNGLKSLIFYLGKIILPVKLVPLYPFPAYIHWLDLQYLLSGILVLAITGFCLWFVKQGNFLFFTAWLYYLITLLPVIGVIQVGGQSAADRYTYLPSISIFLLIGAGASWIFCRPALIKHRGMPGGLVLAFICICIFMGQLTVKQIRIWNNPEVCWEYVIRSFPFPKSHPLAHNNLGNAYAKKGELDKAISEYKRAIARRPWYAKAYNNLGRACLNKGMFDAAISAYKKALTINPNYASAHYNLGSVYAKKGMLDETISACRKAVALNPNHAQAHYNLSVAYYHKGNYKSAILYCDRALALGESIDPRLLEMLKPYR